MLGRQAQHDRRVDLEDDDSDENAADEYVHKYVNLEVGGVAYVEVSDYVDGPWELWRVEGALGVGRALAMVTTRATYEQARKEIGEHAPS
jgi:hypothetical protein